MKKLAALIIMSMILFTGCFNESPEGEIIVLNDNISTGDTIGLVLNVPEEFSDLHKEMWSYELKNSQDKSLGYKYLEEEFLIEENYDEDEVEQIFKDSPIDIYRDDYAMDTLYSPRIAIFKPEESGTYIIYVMGYYRSTSPSEITSLEVIVHESK